MNVLDHIAQKWIVELNKFDIGIPGADMIDTKGKFLIFHENQSVDSTLYGKCGCGILDSEFVEKHYQTMFTESYHREDKETLVCARDNRLFISEVDKYQEYAKTTDKPDSGAIWRNSEYNVMYSTTLIEYLRAPTKGYIKQLDDKIRLGEYRLGYFIN